MANRRNVIFCGMTQNGKSSLIQQILQYAGEHDLARTVGIGHGNISETQTCSLYDVDIPLKSHRLRQIDGPDEAKGKHGLHVIPGEDFDYDDADEYKLGQDVEDSGDMLALKLIDTPGLSDSGNTSSSTSSMRVVDERHKLRILLTLQQIEDVHAICFVVRRDTNFGGDFQALVKRMLALLKFSVRSTAWNLQFHIIHTNIDVDDRSSGICEIRRHAFDVFGPVGATHHFVDNLPDKDSPLEVYFSNHSLAGLFRALARGSAVKFTNLYYPKSPEQECNDQLLVDALGRARDSLQGDIERFRKDIAMLEKDIALHQASADLNQTRVGDYERQIDALDSDTHSEIDSDDGWTEKNFGGGGARLFSFSSSVPIADIKEWNDGDGDWVGKSGGKGCMSYQVTLQPHWLHKAHGIVRILAKKRDKHKAAIETLRKQSEPVRKRRQDSLDQAEKAQNDVARLNREIDDKESIIRAIEGDLETVRHRGHSIMLAEKQTLIKYFTIDSPLSAALAHGISTTIPWTVPPLDKFSRDSVKVLVSKALREAEARTAQCKVAYKVASGRLAVAIGLKTALEQVKRPPLGQARVKAAFSMLSHWQSAAQEAGLGPWAPELVGLAALVSKLDGFLSGSSADTMLLSRREEEKAILQSIEAFSEIMDTSEEEMFKEENLKATSDLQKAFSEETATKIAEGYLSEIEGLPIGVYASFIRASARSVAEPYLTVLSELKDVHELGEMALDD